jgi:hypothetical protein
MDDFVVAVFYIQKTDVGIPYMGMLESKYSARLTGLKNTSYGKRA